MTAADALLVAAGVVAGTMNALAGGGSFVTFPALIWAGLPPIAANASSTVALVPGATASAFAYTTGVQGTGLVDVGGMPFRRLLAVSVAGGLAGAALLLSTPVTTFDRLIPWLLLLATLTFAFGAQAGAWLRARVHIGPATLVTVQFLLGIYGGYFGGAVGLLMLAAWSLLDRHELKALNPTRVVIVTATNAIAVAAFVAAGEVRWPQTLLVLAGALVGGYGGARLGQRLPAPVTRWITLAIATGMTLVFFRRAYG